MAAILKSDVNVQNAQNFIDTIYSNTRNYYITIGGTDHWTDDNVPPTPTDDENFETTFRNNMIGMKKAITTNAALLVPRIQWAPETIFRPLDPAVPAAHLAQDYYCITSNNDVYECIYTPASGAKTGIVEPVVKASEVTTPDGFKWRYLYTVPAVMINNNLLLDAWMPVPYGYRGIYPGGTLTEEQDVSGDTFANISLGAHRVIVALKIADEGETIPYNISYRQVGLLTDPKLYNGNYVDAEKISKDAFDHTSGDFIYLENRRPIFREIGQTETIQIILVF